MQVSIGFSLIIPCYNECATLDRLVFRLEEVFSAKQDCEVILVNNGSTDATAEMLSRLSKDHTWLRTVEVAVNQGYGRGILCGLQAAKGSFLGWTHADLQTDPADALLGYKRLIQENDSAHTFLKGTRRGRPLGDTIFSMGMSVFDSLLFFMPLWEINAQPTIFSRQFYETWQDAPHDFSLDLFAYATAVHTGQRIVRIPVLFPPRVNGSSHWNINFRSKLRFIRRTIDFSLNLRRKWR